jgi:hypothetical protein
VFATRTPQYSDLFTGPLNERQVLTVEVPVLRNGEVIYDLCFSPPVSIFQDLVEKQRPDRQWTMSCSTPRASCSRARRTPARPSASALAVALRRDVPQHEGDASDGLARRRRARSPPTPDRG